jgi:hypothetical protein
MLLAVRLQPVRPGIGHIHPDGAQQPEHLRGAAQVARHPVRREGQHDGVPRRPQPQRLRVAARPGADDLGQQVLGSLPVDRQPVMAQFRAQQFGRRLRRRDCQRRRTSAGLRQGLPLQAGHLNRQRRPATQARGTAVRPAAVDPGRPQLPVVIDGVVGIIGQVEQVRRA